MGPTELIILGAGGTALFVLVAASGLIWQSLRPPLIPIVLPAPLPATAAQPVPSFAFPRRSPADADREIGVLDQVAAIIRDDGEAEWKEGTRLQTNWWNALADQKSNSTYQADWKRFADNLTATISKIEAIQRKNIQYFDGDLSQIIDQMDFGKLKKAADSFRVQFDTLRYLATDPQKVRSANNEISALLYPHVMALQSALESYQAWVYQSGLALAKRRQELSNIASRQK